MRPSSRDPASWAIATALIVSACSGVGEEPESVTRSDSAQTQDRAPASAAPDVVVPEPPGELIDVGGSLMHLYCTGEGTPTVLLEAGAGGISLDFGRVQEELTDRTRVCSYDRAGLGWSEPRPEPRAGAQIVSELESLLEAAGEPGPYVLAGHSLGGPLVLIFAQRHPDDTAGVVLIDASHPRQEEEYAGQFPHLDVADREFRARMAETAARVRAGDLDVSDVFPLTPLGLPLQAREQMAGLLLQPHTWDTMRAESDAVTQTLAQVRGPGSLEDTPLVVLVAGLGLEGEMSAYDRQQLDITDDDVDRFDAIWRDLQEDYLAWSTNSRLVVVDDSTHYIHHDETEVVVEAIGSLLDRN